MRGVLSLNRLYHVYYCYTILILLILYFHGGIYQKISVKPISYGTNLLPNISNTLMKQRYLRNKLILTWDGETWFGKDRCPDMKMSRFSRATLLSSAGKANIYVYDSEIDNVVSKSILNTAIWERNNVEILIHFLRKDQSLDFLDIGSNLGVFALSAQMTGNRVIAIEPFPFM